MGCRSQSPAWRRARTLAISRAAESSPTSGKLWPGRSPAPRSVPKPVCSAKSRSTVDSTVKTCQDPPFRAGRPDAIGIVVSNLERLLLVFALEYCARCLRCPDVRSESPPLAERCRRGEFLSPEAALVLRRAREKASAHRQRHSVHDGDTGPAVRVEGRARRRQAGHSHPLTGKGFVCFGDGSLDRKDGHPFRKIYRS